jgi:hypothetical protein
MLPSAQSPSIVLSEDGIFGSNPNPFKNLSQNLLDPERLSHTFFLSLEMPL